MTNLPARPQVRANAAVDDAKEKVDAAGSEFLAVPAMLKENVPRRVRANTGVSDFMVNMLIY